MKNRNILKIFEIQNRFLRNPLFHQHVLQNTPTTNEFSKHPLKTRMHWLKSNSLFEFPRFHCKIQIDVPNSKFKKSKEDSIKSTLCLLLHYIFHCLIPILAFKKIKVISDDVVSKIEILILFLFFKGSLASFSYGSHLPAFF